MKQNRANNNLVNPLRTPPDRLIVHILRGKLWRLLPVWFKTPGSKVDNLRDGTVPISRLRVSYSPEESIFLLLVHYNY